MKYYPLPVGINKMLTKADNRREYRMARSHNPLATMIIIALVLVLLYALNPTTADFLAWRSAQSEREAPSGATSGPIGTLKSGAGAVAGAMKVMAASAGAAHRDYLVCSTYSFGNARYLGIAHLFFKLK